MLVVFSTFNDTEKFEQNLMIQSNRKLIKKLFKALPSKADQNLYFTPTYHNN